MKLIDYLKDTPIANAQFKDWYGSNKAFTIPLANLLTLPFQYQFGVFYNFFAYKGIGMNATHNGIDIWLLEPTERDKQATFLYEYFEGDYYYTKAIGKLIAPAPYDTVLHNKILFFTVRGCIETMKLINER